MKNRSEVINLSNVGDITLERSKLAKHIRMSIKPPSTIRVAVPLGVSFKEAQIKIKDGVISSGKFVVDMTSLTVEDLSGVGKAKLTVHLNSDDFFSTEKHPEALLTITQKAKVENGVQYLVGELSIKEIQHPIEFTMTLGDNNSAIAHLTFDRSKYEVRFRSGSFFENLGDKLIQDDIKLEANLEWN